MVTAHDYMDKVAHDKEAVLGAIASLGAKAVKSIGSTVGSSGKGLKTAASGRRSPPKFTGEATIKDNMIAASRKSYMRGGPMVI